MISTKLKLLLLVFIYSKISFSTAQTGKQYNNPFDYLSNAWIVEKRTLNDSIVSFDNCIQFFHDDKKSGFFCLETQELQIDGVWSINKQQLKVKNLMEEKIFTILRKDANFMQLEYWVGSNKVQLFCRWKAD